MTRGAIPTSISLDVETEKMLRSMLEDDPLETRSSIVRKAIRAEHLRRAVRKKRADAALGAHQYTHQRRKA